MSTDILTAGIGLIDTFINKFVADKDLAAKLAIQARSEEFQGNITLLTGQMSVNAEEAKSTNGPPARCGGGGCDRGPFA